MNDAVQICADNDCACCEVIAPRRCAGCSYWNRRSESTAAASLTDAQIDAIAAANNMDKTWYENAPRMHWRDFARALLAADARSPKPTADPGMPGEAWLKEGGLLIDRLDGYLNSPEQVALQDALRAHLSSRIAPVQRPSIGPTGREPEMLQDADRKLSIALSNTPGARLHATEAAATISAQQPDKSSGKASPNKEAELTQDAMRYRWLREGRRERQGLELERRGGRELMKNERQALMQFMFWCAPEELDAAVDAAMRSSDGGDDAKGDAT